MPHFDERVELSPRSGLARAFSRSGDGAKVLQGATKGLLIHLRRR